MQNKQIRELYGRWRFNADLMTCNECGYSVIATRMHETAHHAAGCQNEGQANPWLQLADMLQALKVGAGETAKKCDHKNRECTYESDDGEFERWQCKDCGERWGVEIAQ